MLFTAPQTAPATTLPGIIRPQHPHVGQSNEDDYDAAYLDARADDIVGQEADLPLFSPPIPNLDTCILFFGIAVLRYPPTFGRQSHP